MFALILAFICGVGLGRLLPAPWLDPDPGRHFGLRFFSGLAAATILLYFINGVFGVALSIAGYAVGFLSVAGVCLFSRDLLIKRASPIEAALHPVTVLFVALLAVAVLRGGFAYVPYSWDELTSWTGYARQMVIADSLTVSGGVTAHAAYLPGWRYLLALPGSLRGSFDVNEIPVMAFALHVGLLGTCFDLVRIPPTTRSESERLTRFLIAWVVVLLLLAAEASWILLPTNLLVERPQVYLLIGCVLLVLIGYLRESIDARLALHIGLIFAAGYLAKKAMITYAPSLLLATAAMVWLAPAERAKSAWRMLVTPARLRGVCLAAAVIFVPFVLVFFTWSAIGPPGNCANSILVYVSPEAWSSAAQRPVSEMLSEFTDAGIAYMESYKLPLTFLSALGFLVALRTGAGRAVTIGVALFVALYLATLFSAYVLCPSSFNYFLSSFPRYIRVAIRLIHFIGLLLLAIAVLRWTPVGDLLRGRGFRMALAAAVIALFGYQVRALDASMQTMATLDSIAEEDRSYFLWVSEESRMLRTLVETSDLRQPDVLMLAEYEHDLPLAIANYRSANQKRGEPSVNHRMSIQRISPNLPADPSKAQERIQNIRIAVSKADIVWPLNTHPWFERALDGLYSKTECPGAIDRYFLVATGDGTLRCVPKEQR